MDVWMFWVDRGSKEGRKRERKEKKSGWVKK